MLVNLLKTVQLVSDRAGVQRKTGSRVCAPYLSADSLLSTLIMSCSISPSVGKRHRHIEVEAAHSRTVLFLLPHQPPQQEAASAPFSGSPLSHLLLKMELS